ncbi:MAG: EAL domain-containing protein [Firmicutes bacterium]|nr:EAL domain-containing protein [Bacillota bacterium]
MRRKKFSFQNYKEKNDVYQRWGSFAVIIILVLGIAFVCYTYHTQNSVTKQYLHEIAVQSANRIKGKIDNDLARLTVCANAMSEIDTKTKEKISGILSNEKSFFEDDGLIRLSYVTKRFNGYEITPDNEIKELSLPKNISYIQQVLDTGEPCLEARRDAVTGKMVQIYALPVMQEDKTVAVHCGVFALDKFYSDMNMKYFDNNGLSYMIKRDGSAVFANERDDLFRAVSDAFLQRINFANSDSVVTKCNGIAYWLTYTPVNYADWYFVIVAPNSSINGTSERIVIFSVIILLSMLITSVLFLRHIDSIQTQSRDDLFDSAYIDEVTGVFNKNGFSRFMEDVIYTRSLRFVIAYFDFDNFKAINDLFGYTEGDRLLKFAADVLADEIGQNETCGRFSGDNFYVLFTSESQSKLESRVNSIMDKLSTFKFSADSSYDILSHCALVPITDFHRDRTIDFFVDRAKMALASDVKAHKNSFIYYEDAMRKNIVFEAELENDLTHSIENNDFKVYVQPKHSVSTEKLAGGEALIRWQHPTKGFLTPDRFVDIFERNGQVTEIDFYVLEQVCKMQKEWTELGLRPMVISVNQSRMHLYKQDYFDRLRKMIRKYGADPKFIELEITETVAMSNTELLAQATKKLHKMGFRVSIDDFGAGQSSLNVLKDIDVDVIKLDRGFFIELSTSIKGKEIINTVIRMAKNLNIETVSEGIETREQFNFIKKAGCDLVQGFLFGKPMPINDFSELFKESYMQR